MTIFLNPHVDDFMAEPIGFRILGRKPLKKYQRLLTHGVYGGDTITLLVDCSVTSLARTPFFLRFPKWVRRIWSGIEIAIWRRINRIDPKIPIYFNHKKIPNETALFLFSNKNCTDGFCLKKDLLLSYPTLYIHLSHYMIHTAEKARNIQQLPHAAIVGDSDISENPYFKAHFSFYKKAVQIIPFCVQHRFQSLILFRVRSGCCVATGSFHNLEQEIPNAYYQDFMRFFKTTSYHVIRQALYDSRDENREWLTTLTSPFRENSHAKVSPLKKLLLHFQINQKKYFGIDIVSEYNRHRYAVVGEERSGFPALGTFEAMACGCVVLGSDDAYYRGLDMEVGVHYWRYDGTIEGLKKEVLFLESHLDIAEKISQNAAHYIHSNQNKIRSA